MMFFQILTGRYPFYVEDESVWMQSLRDESIRPKFIDSDGVAMELQRLVSGMWRQDSANRPTFKQVLTSLIDFQSHLSQQPPAAASGSALATQQPLTNAVGLLLIGENIHNENIATVPTVCWHRILARHPVAAGRCLTDILLYNSRLCAVRVLFKHLQLIVFC